ncbi:hypothetical protein CBR_g37733 [Chara braunii]|uniref:Uncharacterized protein n=1 Tax=Chara braunii TaxID=69332 RepID=A0A388K026_CHABU|nr:hypothetical protein CBR_g37733 [Chara braunii]|eukprot:GBG63375.1 hypothetical protein CBR_g37733 [Chara braunii]
MWRTCHVAMGEGWQRRGGDATWQWERDGNAEVAMGSGAGSGSEGGHGRGIGNRKAEVAMGTTLRTCQTSHVAHVPRGVLSASPRGVLAPSSCSTWQVRRWRRKRDGDAEVATPSRRRGVVLAPSSSPTGKCGGGDAEVATGAASTPRGKCSLTI